MQYIQQSQNEAPNVHQNYPNYSNSRNSMNSVQNGGIHHTDPTKKKSFYKKLKRIDLAFS